jgi:hypothetical protein
MGGGSKEEVMNCFMKYLIASNKHPAIIFYEALCYHEYRWSYTRQMKYILSFCSIRGRKEEVTLSSVPQFVEDYCLDVLAGRIVPLKLQGEVRERKRLPPHKGGK